MVLRRVLSVVFVLLALIGCGGGASAAGEVAA